jgi:cytoskeletal protein RodZ
MPILTDSDLRDPSPPVPGTRERAAVASRARQLGRKRRMMQGAGALGVVAAVAVGVAALTAGGTSGPTGTGRIEAASSADATTVTTQAPAVTTVPAAPVAPVATEPAPAADTTPAAPTETPAADPTPAPSAFSISGTVAGVPADVTLTLTLTGPGGTFTAIADGAGNFSVSGVPAGTYDGSYEWVSSDGTATQVGRLGPVTIEGDSTISFSI